MRRSMVLAIFAIVVATIAGPAMANQPSPSVGDDSGLNRIVSVPPGSDSILAAGVDGLHRLADGEWTKVADSPPAGALVSDGDSLMLAGEAASCMAGGAPIALSRSEDGGDTWATVQEATGLEPLAIWADQNLALAAACSGLFLSTDLGLTWKTVPGIDPGWDVTSFADVTADSGPVVLVGLTGEGGTSFLHRIDFTDPASPVVSESLREYFAIGGLAGTGDSWILAAMDGAWLTADAGATWTRSADGLDGIVLERDPLEFGLPQDLDMNRVGLSAAALIPGTMDGYLVGSASGLYVKPEGETAWSLIEGTAGKVDQVVVASDGVIAYLVDDQVRTATVP